jgi:hypothetical protein
MKRIFNSSLFSNPFSFCRYNYSNNRYNKTDLSTAQSSQSKHNLFNKKTFPEIINILKNPDNPYPKNAAYYHAIFEYILNESNQNQKIML